MGGYRLRCEQIIVAQPRFTPAGGCPRAGYKSQKKKKKLGGSIAKLYSSTNVWIACHSQKSQCSDAHYNMYVKLEIQQFLMQTECRSIPSMSDCFSLSVEPYVKGTDQQTSVTFVEP